MKAEQSVLTAGYLPLDIVSYRGRTWHAAGGTAGNVAAILGFMGWDSSVAADVGNDAAGHAVQKDLKKSNVSISLVRTVEGKETPRLIHNISPRGHCFRYKCSTCGLRFPRSRPLRKDRALEIAALGLSPGVFFFDRLNAGTILLAEHFSESGSLIVYEPSRPAREDLTERALRVAHIVKYAADRDPGLATTEPRPRQVWIVTGGREGAEYRVGRGVWHYSPAFNYPVVDTGGAGDWTTAGLIHSIPLGPRLTVRAVGDSLRWAQALAAVSCGAPGARGLAAQQSADSVMRAAKFLEQSGIQSSTEGMEQKDAGGQTHGAGCRTCLQLSEARSKTA